MVDGDPYRGAEQREDKRRKSKDQRTEIRFEPDKEDRRKRSGRRITDADPWNNKEKG